MALELTLAFFAFWFLGDFSFFLKAPSTVREVGTRPEGEGEELATARGRFRYEHEPAKTRNGTGP